MSVLVRNKKSQDVFVFAKGSPELINDKSENRREEVARMIADLSL
jgi:magnesium-transporting ATPase (P-type)